MAVAITCLCWYVPVCALQPSEFRKPELGCVGGCLQAPGPDGLRNELWRGSATAAGWLWRLCSRIALQALQVVQKRTSFGPLKLPLNRPPERDCQIMAYACRCPYRQTCAGEVITNPSASGVHHGLCPCCLPGCVGPGCARRQMCSCGVCGYRGCILRGQ